MPPLILTNGPHRQIEHYANKIRQLCGRTVRCDDRKVWERASLGLLPSGTPASVFARAGGTPAVPAAFRGSVLRR
ncbi:hypothetical protein SAMN05519103_02717 [Rhizobiales bacterium GAS113]|nr:hypothetical protein SAMN05519103_02717 [Rhizobiales bacterium GAS113]